MKKYIYITMAAIAGLMFSCGDNDFKYDYSGKAYIRFYNTDAELAADNYTPFRIKTFSFVPFDESLTDKEDSIKFKILITGKTVNYDRSFSLKQEMVAGAANAQAGTQYVAFDDPRMTRRMVIKAGQTTTDIPVIMLRKGLDKTTLMTLKFKVAENKEFEPSDSNFVWRILTFGDTPVKPTMWNSIETNFGAYSKEKHRFMIKNTELNWDNETISSIKDQAELNYINSVMKTLLAEYNAANPTKPLMDDSGDNPIAFK